MADQGDVISDAKLGTFLWAIETTVRSDAFDYVALKAGVESLLVYLASPEGKTDANCRQASSFFSLHSQWDKREVSPSFFGVFVSLLNLRNTLECPDEAFQCRTTPEQLLVDVRALDPNRLDPWEDEADELLRKQFLSSAARLLSSVTFIRIQEDSFDVLEIPAQSAAFGPLSVYLDEQSIEVIDREFQLSEGRARAIIDSLSYIKDILGDKVGQYGLIQGGR
jgi:hypothetical protein